MILVSLTAIIDVLSRRSLAHDGLFLGGLSILLLSDFEQGDAPALLMLGLDAAKQEATNASAERSRAAVAQSRLVHAAQVQCPLA